MSQDKSIRFIDRTLNLLWSTGLSTAVLIISAILTIGVYKFDKIAPLIGAFAILISAGIASASVMKSIYMTKQNDKEKAEKEKERKQIFALNVMKTIHVTLGTLPQKAETQYLHSIGLRDFYSKPDIASDIQTIEKLLNSVFCESILPYLNDDEQNIVSAFYSEFYKFFALYRKEENLSRSVVKYPNESPTKQLHKYVKKFSDYAQSYIDLNTKSKEL